MIRQIFKVILMCITMAFQQPMLWLFPAITVFVGMVLKVIVPNVNGIILGLLLYLLMCAYHLVYHTPLKFGTPFIIKKDENDEVVQTQTVDMDIIDMIYRLNNTITNIMRMLNLPIFFAFYKVIDVNIMDNMEESILGCINSGIEVICILYLVYLVLNVINTLLLTVMGTDKLTLVPEEEKFKK